MKTLFAIAALLFVATAPRSACAAHVSTDCHVCTFDVGSTIVGDGIVLGGD